MEWQGLSEESFKKIFRDSPLKRSKWQGIQRNLTFNQVDAPQLTTALPPKT
jgi:epoxyqueuosine reductase